MHPEFGFMNARIQTWFPFSIQICLNGREWLARQMDQAGIGYRRHDNCFSRIDDYGRAQQLMDEQLLTAAVARGRRIPDPSPIHSDRWTSSSSPESVRRSA